MKAYSKVDWFLFLAHKEYALQMQYLFFCYFSFPVAHKCTSNVINVQQNRSLFTWLKRTSRNNPTERSQTPFLNEHTILRNVFKIMEFGINREMYESVIHQPSPGKKPQLDGSITNTMKCAKPIQRSNPFTTTSYWRAPQMFSKVCSEKPSSGLILFSWSPSNLSCLFINLHSGTYLIN